MLPLSLQTAAGETWVDNSKKVETPLRVKRSIFRQVNRQISGLMARYE
jgi:hypothetical protein